MKRSTRRSISSSRLPDKTEYAIVSPEGKRLLGRIRNAAHENGTLVNGSRILVAISGGPDSVALLHLLLSLRKKLALEIACAHVNYQLRGEDSDKDEALVRTYCARYNVPFFTYHPKVGPNGNEESLRDIRYHFFSKTLEKIGFDVVATAHTEDDQIETFLLRLFRGAGPEGLSGIRPKRDTIIRPLLGVSKRELLTFLKKEHIRFRLDKTNHDIRIPRNRVRHKLIPLLEKEYQPNIRKVLARTATLFLDSNAAGTGTSLKKKTTRASISFSRKQFLSLPETTQADELRTAYRKISKSELNPSEAFVREAKKCIGSQKSKVRRFSSKQLKIEVKGDTVVMIRT